LGVIQELYPNDKHKDKEQHMANIAVGEQFPAFKLPDEHGEPFDLRSELIEGPLMFVFYRGDW
jgi:hypothetical protein